MGAHLKGCNAPKDEGCLCETKRYGRVAIITATILILEVVGGIFSGSLALLSDAAHVGADALAVLVALAVAYFSYRSTIPNSSMRSWGAVAHSVLLFLAGIWIIYEAWMRLKTGSYEVRSVLMFVVAFVGLMGNIWQHRELSHVEENVTSKGLNWHVLSDLWQSVAVVVCGIFIYFTGLTIVDPVISIILGGIFLFWGFKLFIMGREHTGCTHHSH